MSVDGEYVCQGEEDNREVFPTHEIMSAYDPRSSLPTAIIGHRLLRSKQMAEAEEASSYRFNLMAGEYANNLNCIHLPRPSEYAQMSGGSDAGDEGRYKNDVLAS